MQLLDKNIGTGDISEIGNLVDFGKYSKIIVFCDSNTLKQCFPRLIAEMDHFSRAEIIEIDPGEKEKQIETVIQLWQALMDIGADRNSLLVNLGGGVITDMGGFIATTYKRGMDFVHIPTSLLGMVDAAIGGKTGIDLGPYKNQVGTFSQPVCTFIDVAFLETLEKQELLSGYAEVIKHALMKDQSLYENLSNTSFDQLNWKDVVEKAAKIKIEIVQNDPLEKGERKLLNYGHTIGHALESLKLSKGEEVKHGIAVAWGMMVENELAVQLGVVNPVEAKTVNRFLEEIFGGYSIDKEDIPFIIELLKQDKKNVGGETRFTLLKTVGEGITNIEVDYSQLEETLNSKK